MKEKQEIKESKDILESKEKEKEQEEKEQEEKEQVLDLYYRGFRRKGICELTGFATSRVDKYLRSEDIKFKKYRVTNMEKEMMKYSFTEGYKTRTIAETLGYHELTIKKHLKKSGICFNNIIKPEEVELIKTLKNEGLSIAKICKLVDRAPKTVSKYLKQGGNEDV